MVEQMGLEPTTSALRIGLPANAKYLPFLKLQPPRDFDGFSGFFPFLTIAYTLRAVIFGHVLATWKLLQFFCFSHLVAMYPATWVINQSIGKVSDTSAKAALAQSTSFCTTEVPASST